MSNHNSDLAANRPAQAVRDRLGELHQAHGRPAKRSLADRLLRRAQPESREERNWRVGAEGEERAGKMLESLGRDGWFVLHSVPVGSRGSDIDHLLIGPGGVFAVNTKTHPNGRVWVSCDEVQLNGTATQYLRNSRYEASRAAASLSTAVHRRIPVTGLILVHGADVTVREQPNDVTVLALKEAPRHLRSLPQRFTAAQVNALYEAARQRATWQPAS